MLNNMTLDNIIHHTTELLPFEVEKVPNSFTVLGNFGDKIAYTFKYPTKEDMERNKASFLRVYNILKLIETKDNEDRKAYGTAWTYKGDYHTIDSYEIKEIVENLDEEEYEDYSAIYDELTYDGELFERSDSATPIYYHDIAKWFGENWSAVDEYVSEFGEMAQGSDGKPDIMKTIQCAYQMTHERDMTSALESIIDEMEEEEHDEDCPANNGQPCAESCGLFK
jgi:hypothetical protein